MSRLLGTHIYSLLPNITAPIKDYIFCRSTCSINDQYLQLFEQCINKVSEQMQEEGLFDSPDKIPTVNIIISDEDTIHIQLDPEQIAINTHIAFFNLKRFYGTAEHIICLYITEELCHLFWNIKSEFDVNFKVYNILKKTYPNLKLFEIYNKNTMIAEGEKEGKTIPSEYFD